jgi:hypothetical protein
MRTIWGALSSRRLAVAALATVLVTGALVLAAARETWMGALGPDLRIEPPVIVISSDDWGGACPTETAQQLDELAAVLRRHQDAYGNRPVLSAYITPAEPDYQAMARDNFERYAWKSCYDHRQDVARKWRELVAEGLVEVGLHGREHFNGPLLAELMRRDVPGFREAMSAGGAVPYRGSPAWQALTAVDPRGHLLARPLVNASTLPAASLDLEQQRQILKDGVELLQRTMGVRPRMFTAPGYVCDEATCQALAEQNIDYLESIVSPPSPLGNRLDIGWRSGPSGVRFIVRNVDFEPAARRDVDQVERTLSRITWLTRAGMPVVISSHAANYVGSDADAVAWNLRELNRLLGSLSSRCPGLVYLSASDLAGYVYGRRALVRREVPVAAYRATPMDRILNVTGYLWSNHGRFRQWIYLLAATATWAAALIVLRTGRSSGATDGGG